MDSYLFLLKTTEKIVVFLAFVFVAIAVVLASFFCFVFFFVGWHWQCQLPAAGNPSNLAISGPPGSDVSAVGPKGKIRFFLHLSNSMLNQLDFRYYFSFPT